MLLEFDGEKEDIEQNHQKTSIMPEDTFPSGVTAPSSKPSSAAAIMITG